MTASFPEGSKIIRLPRNGPKPGQSMRAWLYGKEREEKEFQRRLAEQDQGQRK